MQIEDPLAYPVKEICLPQKHVGWPRCDSVDFCGGKPWFLRAYVFFQLFNACLAMHCAKGILEVKLSIVPGCCLQRTIRHRQLGFVCVGTVCVPPGQLTQTCAPIRRCDWLTQPEDIMRSLQELSNPTIVMSFLRI